MTKPKRPIILPPRDDYADKRLLLETLVTVARNVLIRQQQQAMLQSDKDKAA